MASDKTTGGNDAFALFPDLMKGVVTAKPPVAARETLPKPPAEDLRPVTAPAATHPSGVAPPPFPDISWLSSGEFVGKAAVSTERKALVLMEDAQGRAAVVRALQEHGFKTELAGSQAEAIEKVKALDFAAIAADEGFTGSPLARSAFHNFMKGLPMERRRAVHYTFIGPQSHTLYNLEALAKSVNLVVNAHDVAHFDIIMRKGLIEYKNLFQPYADALVKRRKSMTP